MPEATAPHIVVVLDGVEHPIRLDEVTARQVLMVRQAFGMAPRAFPRLAASEAVAQEAGRPANSVVDLPEIAAMVFLSRLQTEGLDVSMDEVLDAVTIGSEVTIRVSGEVRGVEVADLDPPA